MRESVCVGGGGWGVHGGGADKLLEALRGVRAGSWSSALCSPAVGIIICVCVAQQLGCGIPECSEKQEGAHHAPEGGASAPGEGRRARVGRRHRARNISNHSTRARVLERQEHG